MPMLPRQRQLIALSLVLLALIFHLTLCCWKLGGTLASVRGESMYMTQGRIVGWASETVNTAITPGMGTTPVPFAIKKYWGLYTRFGVSLTSGVVFGVALPFALLMLNAYLTIGWRHRDKVRQRICPKCGYDLRAVADTASHAKCPECGLAVAPQA